MLLRGCNGQQVFIEIESALTIAAQAGASRAALVPGRRPPHRGGMTGRRPKRAARRLSARAHARLVRDQERLARLEPGGAPDRPLMIDSPVLVDGRAVAKPCPLCGGTLRLDAHTAEAVDGVRLRIASVTCTQCGVHRSVYFRLTEPSVH